MINGTCPNDGVGADDCSCSPGERAAHIAEEWAVAALKRCRVLQAQLDNERRHADELVQRVTDVIEALGEHRTPGRPLADDVRELAQRCAPTWGGT